jgi:hypothetical protein
MTGTTRIPQISTALATRWESPSGSRSIPLEPEHVEEVWDAELVYEELPAPAFASGGALSAYGWAGTALPARRIDVHA